MPDVRLDRGRFHGRAEPRHHDLVTNPKLNSSEQFSFDSSETDDVMLMLACRMATALMSLVNDTFD